MQSERGRDFYIVDVFAEGKYSGNQLAVFPEASGLSEKEMRSLALEMHFSETAFVVSPDQRDGGYDVRIFTPTEEVPFAGHPTLGTAYVINHFLAPEPAREIVLNLKVGQIPVTWDPETQYLWMRQHPPIFGESIAPERMAQILDIPESEIDSRYPIQVVSTGLPFIITPLMSLEAVKLAGLNRKYYPDQLAGVETKAILLFAPEVEQLDNHLHVRVFAEYYGVSEDPATGSANGCLAGYLALHRYFGAPEINTRVEQGYEIHRPSLVLIQTEEENDTISVSVGGRVLPVAVGRLY